MPPWTPTPQTQTFLAIQTMHTMLAHLESLPSKQDMNPSVAVSDARFGELPNPLTKDDRILPRRLISAARAGQRQGAACAPLAHVESVLQKGHEGAYLSDLQSFFSMTS
jgi:hypothetical protein